MANKAQNRLDGTWIDKHQARYVGTIELEGDDSSRAGYGEQLVCVTVVRVGMATVRETPGGENHRTNGFKVVDHHICDPELAEALIDRCNLIGFDQLFTYTPPAETPQPRKAALPVEQRPAEIVPEPEQADEEPLPDVEPEVGPSQEPTVQEAPQRPAGGPKVAHFSIDDVADVDTPSKTEVVGHIGGHRDDRLARFLEEDVHA